MGKFKARYIVVPVLVIGIVGGVVTAAMKTHSSGLSVNVTTVKSADQSSMLGFYDMSGNGGYVGTLKKGSVQNVKVKEGLTLEDVLVKKGDTVKKGDKLLTYNLTSLRISLAEAENTLKTCENEITVANNELTVLKKLQPSENAPKTVENEPEHEPEPEEPEIETPDLPEPMPAFEYEKKITSKSKYVDGKGTAEEPFVYYVGEDTVVTKDGLTMLCPEDGSAEYAIFYVCDPLTGTPLYARLVDGSKIDKENVSDWNVNDGVSRDMTGGFSFDGGSASFASFIVQSQSGSPGDMDVSQMEGGESYEGMEDMFGFSEENVPSEPAQQSDAGSSVSQELSDEITEKDNYKYSKEELKKMISEKEKEIEKLELKKRQYELDVKKAAKMLETGAEIAEIDGSVTFVAKDSKHLSDSGAYISVMSNTGMSVASYIGEFSLSKIDLGMKVKLTDYHSGGTYEGKITSISDLPSQQEQSGSESATESYYEFIVTVDESFDISEDGSVSMELIEDEDNTSIWIDSVFVRAEGAKNYIMAANDDDIIEKRYVTVGRKSYDIIEITGGLSETDRIAFPYGKTREGVKAVDSDYSTVLYGDGYFY